MSIVDGRDINITPQVNKYEVSIDSLTAEEQLSLKALLQSKLLTLTSSNVGLWTLDMTEISAEKAELYTLLRKCNARFVDLGLSLKTDMIGIDTSLVDRKVIYVSSRHVSQIADLLGINGEDVVLISHNVYLPQSKEIGAANNNLEA